MNDITGSCFVSAAWQNERHWTGRTNCYPMNPRTAKNRGVHSSANIHIYIERERDDGHLHRGGLLVNYDSTQTPQTFLASQIVINTHTHTYQWIS